MSVSLKFNIGTHFPESFPRNIQITEIDALNCSSLQESFLAAQRAYIPYYTVSVVESGNENERFYHVYDTAYLSRTNQKKDPITGRPIRKIHYFALKCFQLDKEKICRPVDLLREDVSLNYVLESSDDDINALLLDSTNANIFETGAPEQKIKGRRAQYIIADLIKKGEFFSQLQPPEKQKEILEWLWCAAQGSFKGLVLLVEECLSNKKMFSNIEGQVIALLKERLKAPFMAAGLTAHECDAYMKAQGLLSILNRSKDKKITAKEQNSLEINESKQA